MFFRHSQVRLIWRLDLVLVLAITFRKLLDDFKDLRRKPHTRSGQELNFLADPKFVRCHSIPIEGQQENSVGGCHSAIGLEQREHLITEGRD